MKEAIWEYIPPSNQEKKALWDRAVFVFDTNVLLNLYRCTKETSESLLSAMEGLKGRVFLPHQVAWEYGRRRTEVIFERAAMAPVRKKMDEFLTLVLREFRMKEEHARYKGLKRYVEKWVEDSSRENTMAGDPADDKVLVRLLALFDGCTGTEYADEAQKGHREEFAKRAEQKTPPGYKDKEKADNGEGDYLVWRQIMDYAKAEEKDVILVTDDQKEDWVYSVSGKKQGPRPELRREFRVETGRDFYLYTSDSFVERAESQRSKEDKKKAAEEIRQVEESEWAKSNRVTRIYPLNKHEDIREQLRQLVRNKQRLPN